MISYSHTLPHGLEIITDSVVEKTVTLSMLASMIQTERLIKHFIKNPDPLVVPTYSFNRLENLKYSYTMKRLGILSQEEKSIINLLILAKSQFIPYLSRDRFLENKFVEIEQAKKDYPSLFDFMNEVLVQGRYRDLHTGNFLKDEYGDYKIIDLEGFLIYPTDTRNLDWITNESS